MGGPVKKRRYDSSRRRAAAEETRGAVLLAARDLFTTRGYAATSVAEIAAAAGVSVDTLYAVVGRKPQLLLAVHDIELAEGDGPLATEQRRYVQDVRSAGSAEEKIDVYAAALARVLPRSVPLLEALRVAGQSDSACREAYESVSERRAANMRLFAADLRTTGRLRDDLDDDAVADLVWSMNSPDYFQLLRSRGYSPGQYAALVRDVWTRTLLVDVGETDGASGVRASVLGELRQDREVGPHGGVDPDAGRAPVEEHPLDRVEQCELHVHADVGVDGEYSRGECHRTVNAEPAGFVTDAPLIACLITGGQRGQV